MSRGGLKGSFESYWSQFGVITESFERLWPTIYSLLNIPQVAYHQIIEFTTIADGIVELNLNRVKSCPFL